MSRFRSDNQNAAETSPDGRYVRLDEKLGSGAYKDVYRCYDTETGSEKAWNTIYVAKLPDEEKERIKNETIILSKLDHPNIIRFHHVWENFDKQEICFTTDIVTSGTLKQYISRIKTLKLKIIKSWLKQILSALDYLHNLDPPIIHRDLKCDNLGFNSSNSQVVLFDFGLAKERGRTHVESVLGTPEFMAPELYDETGYTESVDIYAFGMTVLEMVAKEYPYEECQNAAQIWKKVVQGIKPQVLSRIRTHSVKSLIEMCICEPEKRLFARELLEHPFFKTSSAEDEGIVIVDPKPSKDGTVNVVISPTIQSQQTFMKPIVSPATPNQIGFNTTLGSNIYGTSPPSMLSSNETSAINSRLVSPLSANSPATPLSPNERGMSDHNVNAVWVIPSLVVVNVVVDLCGTSPNNSSMVSVVLHIHLQNRKKKQIKFDFDLSSDTCNAIASEMMKALKLPNDEHNSTTNLISEALFLKIEPIRQHWLASNKTSTGLPLTSMRGISQVTSKTLPPVPKTPILSPSNLQSKKNVYATLPTGYNTKLHSPVSPQRTLMPTHQFETVTAPISPSLQSESSVFKMESSTPKASSEASSLTTNKQIQFNEFILSVASRMRSKTQAQTMRMPVSHQSIYTPLENTQQNNFSINQQLQSHCHTYTQSNAFESHSHALPTNQLSMSSPISRVSPEPYPPLTQNEKLMQPHHAHSHQNQQNQQDLPHKEYWTLKYKDWSVTKLKDRIRSLGGANRLKACVEKSDIISLLVELTPENEYRNFHQNKTLSNHFSSNLIPSTSLNSLSSALSEGHSPMFASDPFAELSVSNSNNHSPLSPFQTPLTNSTFISPTTEKQLPPLDLDPLMRDALDQPKSAPTILDSQPSSGTGSPNGKEIFVFDSLSNSTNQTQTDSRNLSNMSTDRILQRLNTLHAVEESPTNLNEMKANSEHRDSLFSELIAESLERSVSHPTSMNVTFDFNKPKRPSDHQRANSSQANPSLPNTAIKLSAITSQTGQSTPISTHEQRTKTKQEKQQEAESLEDRILKNSLL